MVYQPENDMTWPLQRPEHINRVPVARPISIEVPQPALDEIEQKVRYYQPGETRLDLEDWCREVARIHYNNNQAERIPWRPLMKDAYWIAAFRNKMKPQAAYDESELGKAYATVTCGVLKDRKIPILKTVVRS